MLGFSVLRFWSFLRSGFSFFALKMSGFSVFLSVVVFGFFFFKHPVFGFYRKRKAVFWYFFQLRFLVSKPFCFTWCGTTQVTFPVKVAHKTKGGRSFA